MNTNSEVKIPINENIVATPDHNRKFSFSKYLKEIRIHNKKRGEVTTRELAYLVGLDYEQFRKIINMQKETKKRDCIIAISAVLCLNSAEASDMLIKYNYMPTLDPINPRDDLIIDILENQENLKLNIDEINNRLSINNFPPLDIIDRRKARSNHLDQCRFNIIKKAVKSFASEPVYDQHNSLETMYTFEKYLYSASLWLEDNLTRELYKLTTNSDETFFVDYVSTNERFVQINTIEESGEFADYFVELQSMIRSEQSRIESYLNDTKNYYKRIGAKTRNGKVHIFMETFNYIVPERNEYYLFEYIDGSYRISVSHQSLFMKKYLSEKEYEQHYGKKASKQFEIYNSLDEIEKLYSTKRVSDDNRYILKSRIDAYKKMKYDIDKCLEQLRNRQLYIRDLEHIYEDKDRVCEFYDLTKEFKCTTDESGDVMIAGVNSVMITTRDNQTVSLSIFDLYRAFELGFNDVDEICLVKKSQDSVEAILY